MFHPFLNRPWHREAPQSVEMASFPRHWAQPQADHPAWVSWQEGIIVVHCWKRIIDRMLSSWFFYTVFIFAVCSDCRGLPPTCHCRWHCPDAKVRHPLLWLHVDSGSQCVSDPYWGSTRRSSSYSWGRLCAGSQQQPDCQQDRRWGCHRLRQPPAVRWQPLA